jgi:hypothetical protein
MPRIVSRSFPILGVGVLLLLSGASDGQDAKKSTGVTLTLVRVRAQEFWSTPLEGEHAGKKLRNVLFAFDVILDNQTGEDLDVYSHFFSPFDGLSMILLRDGNKAYEQAYMHHQSPQSRDSRPHILKKGKTERQLRIPVVGSMTADWMTFEAKLVGTLPGSKYKGKLESKTMKVMQW